VSRWANEERLAAGDEQVNAALWRKCYFGENARVLVAGSTHPGEDELLIDAYKQILEKEPNFQLVLVPRHPRRAEQIMSLLKDQDICASRISEVETDGILKPKPACWVIDTIGQLNSGTRPLILSLSVGAWWNMGATIQLKPRSFRNR